MRVTACVVTMTYPSIRKSTSFAVWLYDLDKPLNPDHPNPCGRYETLGLLDVFKTREKAVMAAEKATGVL